jgi:ubiquinone/menaquinone biosynthesis C-methylase UbiE
MKRIEIRVNLKELEVLLQGLDELAGKKMTSEELKAYHYLQESLAEHYDSLEQDEMNDRMYFEDEDGEKRLTDEGKEALGELEADSRGDR